jgi:Uma2 family endonuclease
VPDVLVLDAAAPDEQIITHPPLAVFEVLSRKDRVQRVMRKLVDCETMGTHGIYLVDPQSGAFRRFRAGDLVSVLECLVGRHTFATAEIARLLR